MVLVVLLLQQGLEQPALHLLTRADFRRRQRIQLTLFAFVRFRFWVEDAGRLDAVGVVYPFPELGSFELDGRADIGLGGCVGLVVVVSVASVRLVTDDVEHATDARAGGRGPHVEDVCQLRRCLAFALLP